MTTNIDRAAEVLADWADSEGGLASIDRDYDGDMAGASEALADATPPLLMPDLPETTHDGTWELPSGESIRVSRNGIQAGTTRTPAEARSYALALLAAANYAERNQE